MQYSSMATRSSLELMLDKIQQKTEYNNNAEDLPPALPARPISKARLPRGRRSNWPIKFQEIDSNENGTKEDIEESVRVTVSVAEANEECSCGDNGGCLIQTVDTMDDPSERAVQGILGIQKYFRGHQARCCYHELKQGTITLQSFVRAENARNRKNIASTALKTQQTAVTLLQSVIRGWLSRRHLNHTKNVVKISHVNENSEDYVHIPYYDVLELQRRVLKTEAAVQNKKEENAGLRVQIEEYEKKWQQSESKMKSMEQMWQDRLTSIQVSLADLAKTTRSYAAKNTGNQIEIMNISTPLHHQVHNACQSTARLCSDLNPEEELQKLKIRFEAWNKGYKTRLHETKATFQKLDTSEVKRSSKKWWGR